MSKVPPPLNSSLFPQGLNWLPVPSSFLSGLPGAVVESFDAVSGMTERGTFRYGRGVDRGGRPIFAAFVPADRVSGYLDADLLAQRAAAMGVKTPLLLEVVSVVAQGGCGMLVRPWCEGAHPPDADADFHQLGLVLGRLHSGMGLGQSHDAERTRERLERIGKLPLAFDRWSGVAPPSDLKRLTGDWQKLAGEVVQAPVICHGDLHAGNILLGADRAPTLLDFEEAPHSHLNPMSDLARVFERLVLVLVDTQGQSWVFNAAKALLLAYKAQGNHLGKLARMADMLAFQRALAARVCIGEGDPQNPLWQTELLKILNLAKLADRHSQLIGNIETNYDS
jgi:Phosphotransferase enzyme family